MDPLLIPLMNPLETNQELKDLDIDELNIRS